MTYPIPPYGAYGPPDYVSQQPTGQPATGSQILSQIPGQAPGQYLEHVPGRVHSHLGHIPGHGVGHAPVMIPYQGSTRPAHRPPIIDRPYHAKRPHKKSRAGCHNCKARKVKCDEARPRCRACTQRKEACNYPQSTHTSTSAARATTAAAAASSTVVASSWRAAARHDSSTSSSDESRAQQYHPASNAPPPDSSYEDADEDIYRPTLPIGVGRIGWQGYAAISRHRNEFGILQEPMFRPRQFDETDMKLLWFYTAKGFDAFSSQANRQPKVDEVLQVIIPRHAFAHSFLMDCLLALSALELRSLSQPIEMQRVLKYRAQAFTGYRRAVQGATPDKYPALLSCSLLLCALSSEMFRDPECPPLYILDWIIVWRGIGLIVKLIDPAMLLDSGLSILFARPPINMEASAKFVPNNLLLLLSLIGPADPDYVYVDAYIETLKLLGSLYRDIRNGLGMILFLRIITWFTFLPEGFVEAARRRRPLALIIVGHYLIFVKLCSHLWWMRGISDKEIRDINNVLSDEWLHFYTAPLAALAIQDSLELRNLLLREEYWTPDHYYDAVRDSLVKDRASAGNKGDKLVYTGSWMKENPGKAEWKNQDYLELAKLRFNEDELSEMQLPILRTWGA
ncbi:transcription factor [Ophiostoma piceae UAMH 11346]|uniref:Transcription factor n=1 Tax=Ophiostoma piceae (strain UAMH 11346) TaxID=1262450 RepID=S3C6G9_OPHP1|nr:transcription factor [Ophiostoma piceae UAMH 11346]